MGVGLGRRGNCLQYRSDRRLEGQQRTNSQKSSSERREYVFLPLSGPPAFHSFEAMSKKVGGFRMFD
jgi:hypothetical protein